jgi:PAS domain S-box-containing protein
MFGLAFAYWQAKQSLRETIGLTFRELARQSADKVGLILEKEIEWVERLSTLPEVREAVREGTRLTFDWPALQRLRETQIKYFRSVILLDRHGRSVGGITSEPTRIHYNMQPWWPVVFEQRRSWAGELRLDMTGHGYWEVVVPIPDEAGQVIGALKVVIENDQLFASVLRSRIGETGHVMVVGKKGVVLACPILQPALHARTAIPLGVHDQAGRPVVSGANWTEVENDTHGGRGVIVGVSPVLLSADIVQEEPWYILVRQDPGETYTPLLVLIKKLAAFGILAVAVVVLLRWRLARRIVQPVKALVERVRSLGQATGVQPSPIARPSGIVEIDALAASFDELAERLERASRERAHYVADLESANRELAISEQHYRMLWNHAADTKLLVDADGIIRDINRRGEIKLWKPASCLIGTNVDDLFLQDDRARFRRVLKEVCDYKKDMPAGELRVLSPTEETFIMDVDLVPVENAGSLVAVMLQLSDLTDKKRLEEQLVRSERLASLSKFASMFAHDIRNPLVGIKKTLELLAQRTEIQAEPEKQCYEDMRFTTDLLLGMINDMLDVYQESYSGLPLLTSTVSVKALVDEVTHLFRSEATAKRVSFHLELPEGEVPVTADGRRLLRVLINLVHNALKFSPAGGMITISVREEAERFLKAGLRGISPAAVIIQVVDEGPGVAPQDLPHVFELFFRKKDEQDIRIGRGLGLHFCRLVVEAHHGRIWAENRPSGGAVFSIGLPVQQGVYAGQSADR